MAPKWRHLANITWSTPRPSLDVNVRWRYIGTNESEQTSTNPLLSGTPYLCVGPFLIPRPGSGFSRREEVRGVVSDSVQAALAEAAQRERCNRNAVLPGLLIQGNRTWDIEHSGGGLRQQHPEIHLCGVVTRSDCALEIPPRAQEITLCQQGSAVLVNRAGDARRAFLSAGSSCDVRNDPLERNSLRTANGVVRSSCAFVALGLSGPLMHFRQSRQSQLESFGSRQRIELHRSSRHGHGRHAR